MRIQGTPYSVAFTLEMDRITLQILEVGPTRHPMIQHCHNTSLAIQYHCDFYIFLIFLVLQEDISQSIITF